MADEKSRHERLHQPLGIPFCFKGRWEVSPLSNQPPCEVCGQPRGTPMPKDEPRVEIGPRLEVEYEHE